MNLCQSSMSLLYVSHHYRHYRHYRQLANFTRSVSLLCHDKKVREKLLVAVATCQYWR